MTNTGTYTTALACAPTAGLVYQTGALTGTYTVPAQPTATTCTFTNTRTSAQLVLRKAWVNGAEGDTAGLTIAGQPSGEGAVVSEVGDESSFIDDENVVTRTVYSGEVLPLAEVLGENTGTYTTALACAPTAGLVYQTGALTGTYTVPAQPTATTCTFTNTRTSAQLVLRKAWVNGAEGDTAGLTIAGQPSGEGAVVSEVGDESSFIDDENVVTRTVYSGEVLPLAEVLGENTGTYTTALACAPTAGLVYQTGALTGTYTVPAQPTATTCTFTNTRTSAQLVLRKAWVNGAEGDTAGLTIAGQPSGEGAVVSEVGDESSFIDDENVVTRTVYSGEVLPLAEVLGENTGTYTTALACAPTAGLVYQTGALTGTYTVPAQPTATTCTFTNTRTVGDLVIKKVVVGDIAGASTDFTVNVDCGPEDGFDYTGVLLNEANNWTVTLKGINSGLSCVVTEASVPAGWALTSISPSPAVIGGTPVTVTVTNTRTVGDLVVKKVVVGPIAGATTDFTVNVDCTPGTTYDKTGVVLNQANNWTVTYTGIPTGVSCVVTEPVVPAGWTLTSISPTPAVIGGTPVTVTVTNTRNGIPGLDKTSAPADGVAQVAPGDLINYSVTVSNTAGCPSPARSWTRCPRG